MATGQVQAGYRSEVLQRIGGVGLIVGGILTVLGAVLTPRVADPADYAGVVTTFGANAALTKTAFLVGTVGLWAMVVGFAAIYRALTGGAAAAWSRLGFYGVLVGIALITVTSGLAIGAASEGAMGSGNTGAVLLAAGMHVRAFATIAFWLALAFLGLGVALSTVYPKWSGWTLLVLGAAMVILAGLPAVYTGPTQTVLIVSTVITLLTAVWALAVGVWVTRREMKAM